MEQNTQTNQHPRISVLSAQEISRSFLQRPPSRSGASSLVGEANTGRDLTATARFVIREVQKRLGQYHAETCGDATPAVGATIQDEPRALSEEAITSLVRSVEAEQGEFLCERERTAVVAAISASYDHYDILSPLVQDVEVNDIIVADYRDISVQKNRGNEQTSLQFADPDSYRAFIERLLKRVGKACTMATPVVDLALDANVRACVTHESFSPPGSGPLLTLRIARHKNISLSGLASTGLAPDLVLSYLSALVVSGQVTILIAGEVGTGKTTLLKALAHEVPSSEAILVIEDTHEIVLNRRFVRTLLTRDANSEGAGRIAPAQAIRAGMRMAMNRLLLGEMRDAEAAEAFVDVCASGHSGMSTIHARSGRDALARLELFLARRQAAVGESTIRRQIANALSVVVHLGLDPLTKKRRIMEVLEIGSSGDGAIQSTPVFRCRVVGDRLQWNRETAASLFRDELMAAGVTFPETQTPIYSRDQVSGESW